MARTSVRGIGRCPVGVGFITWALTRHLHLLDLALDRAPAALLLSCDDFQQFLPRIRTSQTKLIVQVQTLDLARKAVDAGVDAIVAQGAEAGGHGGGRATLPLVAAGLDSPPGWNLRTMRNAFTKRWSGDIDGLARNLAGEQARFEAARAADDTEVAAVIVGEAADLVRCSEPARATLHRMISQAENRLRQIGRLVGPDVLD